MELRFELMVEEKDLLNFPLPEEIPSKESLENKWKNDILLYYIEKREEIGQMFTDLSQKLTEHYFSVKKGGETYAFWSVSSFTVPEYWAEEFIELLINSETYKEFIFECNLATFEVDVYDDPTQDANLRKIRITGSPKF